MARTISAYFCFVLFCALRQRRRDNIALITTLPVLNCLNSAQDLQPKCLEDRFLPQQTIKKSTAKAQSLWWRTQASVPVTVPFAEHLRHLHGGEL